MKILASLKTINNNYERNKKNNRNKQKRVFGFLIWIWFYVNLLSSNFLNTWLAVNISESSILATVNEPPTTAHIDVINVYNFCRRSLYLTVIG